MERLEVDKGFFVTKVAEEKFKRCLISIQLVLPSKRSNATNLAILPHLLERRCEAVPDPVMFKRKLSGLYGAQISCTSYISGKVRVLGLEISGLKNEYALDGENLASEYLNLLCEVLFRPKFCNGVFELQDVQIEKEKQEDFLKSEMNDKRSYCLRQARRKLFKNSELGIERAGYLEDIKDITPESLTKAYKMLLQQAQVNVFVCGADEKHVADKLKEEFLNIKRDVQPFEVCGATNAAKKMEIFEEAMDTVQGKLAILCTSGEVANVKQTAALRVAAAVLGGLPSSRLFTNVREKQGLCYYCAASYDTAKSVLTIDSGIEHENAGKAAKAILHEFEILQKELISEKELEFAHLALKNSLSSAKDSPDILVGVMFSEQLRGSNKTLDELIELFEGVTREDVREALAKLTPSVHYTITNKKGAAQNAK